MKMLTIGRDIHDATRPTDTVDAYVLGRLKVRVFGVRVPARLFMFLRHGVRMTRAQLLNVVEEA